MIHLTISQIGLIADMIGVLLLFRFGLPSKVESPEFGFILSPNTDPVEKATIARKNRIITIGANTGLTLAFVGFLLQLLGSFK